MPPFATSTLHPAVRYLLPLASVALVLLVDAATGPGLRPVAFAPFTLAILVSAWLGGLGPGLVATVLVSLAEALVGPGGLALRAPDPLRLATFLVAGTVITALTSSLQSARARLAAYIESMSDGFFSLDRDRRLLYVNAHGAQLFGRSPRDLVGRRLLEVFPAAEGTPVAEAVEGVLRDGAPRTLELYTASFGRWLEVNVYRSGGVVACFVRDVTERKRSEDALREHSERLALAMDAGGVGVWDWDITADRVTWSERTYRIHGLAEGEFDGAAGSFLAMVHPDDRRRVEEAIQRALERDEPYELDLRIIQPSGRVRWLATTARVQRDESGRPRRMLGATRDITDHKHAEAERERLLASERVARGEAERANRMKDEFLATLSHELRTPLQAIVGWARLLRSGRLDAERTTQGIETLERNALAQTQLIEDLLDMNRIVTGKIRLEVAPVALAPVVETAIETLRPAAEAKHLQIVRILDDAAMVRGDVQRLQQVAWNLLSNAVKFTPPRGRVTVTLRRAGSHVEVVVADTGRGISPEFLPLVFDRFRQADASTTRQSGGLGLGLAIVRHLVELHGGSVEVASDGEGRGACFTVRLPLAALDPGEADGDGRPAARATVEGDGESPRLDGLRVLVVEDDADARALIARVLENGGAVVQAVASAAQALAEVRSRPPDVLVSDIGMPGEDGYDLIRQVRALPPERGGRVPSVALTAFARSEDRTRALLSGYQMHMAKPVEPAELLLTVASLAGRVGPRAADGA